MGICVEIVTRMITDGAEMIGTDMARVAALISANMARAAALMAKMRLRRQQPEGCS